MGPSLITLKQNLDFWKNLVAMTDLGVWLPDAIEIAEKECVLDGSVFIKAIVT